MAKSNSNIKNKSAQAELKQFRSDVAKLKKKGLLDKKYDARSVTPSKYLNSQIKKFSSVISDDAVSIKVSKENAKYYKDKGYSVKNGRVVVPVNKATDKVFASRGNFVIKTKGSNGETTRYNLIAPKNIEEWEKFILSKHIELKPNERLSFQLFGHNSYRSFRRIGEMVEYLNYYASYEKVKNGSADEQDEYIQNIVLVKYDGTGEEPQNFKKSRAKARPIDAAKAREYYRNMIAKMSDAKREEFRQKQRENQKKYRESANLSESEKQLKRQKQAAYQKKYREKNK